ncbi:MAG: hypothetical protein MUO54_13535 [Anaerolineales bacterium]|nr:hypothetical protein [Anaerolineales bacterium]
MEIVNHYSMLWTGVFILGVAAFFFLRKGYKPKSGLKLLGLAAVLLVGWLVLRPQQASTTELTQFKAELGQGQNVLLEMQSPY